MTKLKEGKKGSNNPFENVPINNSETKCDKCNGDLIKLETILGKIKIRKNIPYKDMYWVYACVYCGRYVKVLDHEVRIGDSVVTQDNSSHPNKIYKLRER